jgi:MFS family permease
VGDTFPPEKHGRALGVLGAVYGVAFVIGPIFAGIVLSIASWSWLFWLTAPLSVGVAGIGWRVLPATPATGQERLDVAGMVTIGGLLAALAYGVNQIDTQAVWRSLLTPQAGLMLVVAAVLVPVFIRVERRAADPLLRLDLFSSRSVQIASALAVGAGLTEAAFIFFPDLAVAAFGVSKSAASFMLLPLVVAVAIGSPIAGRLLDRVGVRRIVLTGTMLLAVGFAVLGGLAVDRLTFYGGSILIGLGLACLLGSSLSYILLQESSAAERTVAQGVIALFLGVGQLLGGALIGAVAESGPGGAAGYAQAFLLIAGVAVALLGLATQLRRHRPTSSAAEA